MYKALLLFFISFLILSSSACKGEKRYHDEVDPISVADSAIADILRFQREQNAYFRDPETSPLPDKYRKNFEGLNFYEPNTAYRVTAVVERTPDALPFAMPTTTDRVARERRFGIVEFNLQSEVHHLELYQSAESGGADRNTLFLPFLDETNGEETYAGGRYLELDEPVGDTLVIDFNRAYNPYCVYNPKYSCPIVPRVNTLNIAVKAGEKDFKRKP